MKEIKNDGFATGLAVGAITWLVSGMAILINWSKLPPELPFLYSLPVGEQQLIAKPWLMAAWGGFGLIMWIDGILAWKLDKSEVLLKKYLIWGGVVTEILFMLTVLRIIQVII